MSLTFIQTLSTMKASKNKDFACTDLIFERRADACQLTESFFNQPHVKLFVSDILTKANFKLQCPYKVGLHSLTNFTFNIPKRIPLPTNVYLCYSIKFSGKIQNATKFVQFGRTSMNFYF